MRVPGDFFKTCRVDWTGTETARKEYIQRYFSHIHDDLVRVLTSSTHKFTPRAFYELPIRFRWSFRLSVTLIGDAVHVFTPFAGECVNAGMKDALILAQEIVRIRNEEKSLDEGLKDYEEEMFPRSIRVAVKKAKGKEGYFSGTGAKEFADRIKAHYDEVREK